MPSTVIIFVFVIILIVWWYSSKIRRNGKYLRNIPGPTPVPIFGNTIELLSGTQVYLGVVCKWLKNHGDTIVVHDGPLSWAVITIDYDFSELIYSSSVQIDKSCQYSFLSGWLGEGLLTSTGSKWKSHRKVITPSFHFSILPKFIDIFERVNKKLIDKLETKVGEGSIEISQLISLCTLDIICEAAMGVWLEDTNKNHANYIKSVKGMCNIVVQRIASPVHESIYKFTWTQYKESKLLKVLHGFVDEVIERKIKDINTESKKNVVNNGTPALENVEEKERMVFLDLLLKSNINGRPLTKTELRDEVNTFMFEGHDTTSSAMSFCLYNLSTHPEVQAKVFEEQRLIFGDNVQMAVPTHTQLGEMKYLESVIKETLRLYPPVPFVGRKLTKDIEFNGSIYPKGLNIMLFTYGIQRSEKYYEEPEKFIPERFEILNGRLPYSYVPFSAGPRNCIGQKFAMLELLHTISKIVRHFELKPPASEHQIVLAPELILISKNGIRLSVSKRNYMVFLLLFITISGIMLLGCLISRKIKDRSYYLKNVPGPKPLYFFGNSLDFVNTEGHIPVADGYMKKYGDIVLVHKNSFQWSILTADYEFIELIFSSSTAAIDKPRPYSLLHGWLGTGLLTSSGTHWRKHRKMITPAFHFSILQKFVDVFENVGDILINKLQSKVGEDTYEISKIISLYALDVISETAMGVKINALSEKESEYIKNIKIICNAVTIKMNIPIHKVLYPLFWVHHKEQKALKYVHQFVDQVIEKRVEELDSIPKEEKANDDGYGIKNKLAFLDILLKSTIDGQPLTRKEVRDEVNTFMFEGHDTTSSAISFCLYHLSTHKDVQEKVYQEQQQIFGSDLKNAMATYSQLLEMKYLEMAIKETLRLYPSVPLIGRKLTEDVEFKGNIYPKDMNVIVYAFGYHRQAKHFPEPNKFIPERFESQKDWLPFSYVPFSAGPRNCIGQKYAMLEMLSVISKIVRNFELEPSKPEHKIALAPELILISKNGVRLTLKNRK
ncbi:probable cytochrome P450 4d14 [Sitophilus oryzae]|uniref:Probable cytochrome P450 4d14 n=1 Tax=Sitophilus oryzae TaxID=7048 RepID=A0A6J2XEE1_SITOR|nr:probable cytochrome P450 4d14 [Sitophilus oryzae]